MKPTAVVPVKSFALAKSRLDHLPPADRIDFARSLVHHVLAVLADVELAGVVVITNGDDAALLACELGAEVVRDPESSGLGSVVDAALAHAARSSAAALVVMADLPRLTAAEVRALIALMHTHQVVIAPDTQDLGVNALGLRPPDLVPTCFGHPDSFARHTALFGRRGIDYAVHRAPGLGLDIDVPADYRALGELGHRRTSGARPE